MKLRVMDLHARLSPQFVLFTPRKRLCYMGLPMQHIGSKEVDWPKAKEARTEG